MTALSLQTLSLLASPLNAKSEILGARLRSLTCEGELYQGGDLEVETRVEVSSADALADDGTFIIRARYLAEAAAEGSQSTVWSVEMELEAGFGTDPSIRDEVGQLNIAGFGLTTGIMSIHPFARETLQATVSRMGFPPYVLPFMRLGGAQPSSEVTIDFDVPESAVEAALSALLAEAAPAKRSRQKP